MQVGQSGLPPRVSTQADALSLTVQIWTVREVGGFYPPGLLGKTWENLRRVAARIGDIICKQLHAVEIN